MARYLSAAVAGVLALSSTVLAQPGPQPTPLIPCTYNVPNVNAGYDLSSLTAEAGFLIADNRNNSAANNGAVYNYYVSVCRNMNPPTQYCATTNGDDGSTMSGPAPAFQVCVSDACNNDCHRLGNTAANGVFSSMLNPAHGVSLLYTGGDNCTTPNGYRPRSMYLDFFCEDTSGFMPENDRVVEDITCGYHAIIFSRIGCPVQCPFVGNPQHLCGNNGICDFDRSQNAARCFCNTGFSGSDCRTLGDKGLPPPTSYGGNIAGGFFGGIFAGVVVAAIFVFARSKMTGKSFKESMNVFGGVNVSSFTGGSSAKAASMAESSEYSQMPSDYAPPASA